MTEFELSNSSKILRYIIKNSLFTERQIVIILNQKNLMESKFSISKGAYYRQTGQCKSKLMSFYFTIVLLRSLGIVLPDDFDVMSRLSEQVSVIRSSDVFPEREDEVISVIERVIHQACNV